MDPDKMKEMVINKDGLIKDGYPDVIDETSDKSSTEPPASATETWREPTSEAFDTFQEIQEIKGPGVTIGGNKENTAPWSTTTADESGSSTEAYFDENKDNAGAQGSKTFGIGTRPLQPGNILNNQINNIRDQMAGATTEDSFGFTDRTTGSTEANIAGFNKDQVNNAANGQFPLGDTSSTSNPHDRTTTDNIIGNTGPLTNIHDNILKIENEQQYIVNAQEKKDSVFKKTISTTTEQYDDPTTKGPFYDFLSTQEYPKYMESDDEDKVLELDKLTDQKQVNEDTLQLDPNPLDLDAGQPQWESQNDNLIENKPIAPSQNGMTQLAGSQQVQTEMTQMSGSLPLQSGMTHLAGSSLGQSGGQLLFNQGNVEPNVPVPGNGLSVNSFDQNIPSQQQSDLAAQQQMNRVAQLEANLALVQQGNAAASQQLGNNDVAQQGSPLVSQLQQEHNAIAQQESLAVSQQQINNDVARQANPAMPQQGYPALAQQQGNLALAHQQPNQALVQQENSASAQQQNSMVAQQGNNAIVHQGYPAVAQQQTNQAQQRMPYVVQQSDNVQQQGQPLMQQQAFQNTQQFSNSGLQGNVGQQFNQHVQPIVNGNALQQQLNPAMPQQGFALQQQGASAMQQQGMSNQQNGDSASFQPADRFIQQQQGIPALKQQQHQEPQQNVDLQSSFNQAVPPQENAAPQQQLSSINTEVQTDFASGLDAFKQQLSSGIGVANGVLNHQSNNEDKKR